MRLELLIDRLAKHKRLHALLDATTNLPADDLVDSLIKEIEQVAERYKALSVFAGEARTIATSKLNSQELPRGAAILPAQASRVPDRSLKTQPIRISLPELDMREAEQKAALRHAEEERKKRLEKELEGVALLIQAEVQRDWETRTIENRNRVLELKHSQDRLRKQLELLREAKEEPVQIAPAAGEAETDLSGGDFLYLHAACHTRSPYAPMRIETVDGARGIDGKCPVVLVEHRGIGMFVSTLKAGQISVTSSGVLLLNKEDALQFREAHESVLNSLRKDHAILPWEFGMVATGREELGAMIESDAVALQEAIDAEARATAWQLKLYALDGRVRRLLADRAPSVKVQEKAREERKSVLQAEIKSLEKVLQHERSAAETIHAILSSASTSSRVDALVSLGSGMSADWKLILDVTYDIPALNRAGFVSTIAELQEEYRETGLLFALHGPAGRYSFTQHPVLPHAASA